MISAGGYHNMLLTSNGQILSWGSNTYGQCGHDPNNSQKLYKPSVIYASEISNNMIK